MTNRLIPTNAEPLYRQLMARIRDDVSSGVYPPESQIPSEQEMCARYGVSRVTVRRAISELTDEGILRKQQGKGTFVCTPKLCRDLRDINSFHECCRMQGVTPGTRLSQHNKSFFLPPSVCLMHFVLVPIVRPEISPVKKGRKKCKYFSQTLLTNLKQICIL